MFFEGEPVHALCYLSEEGDLKNRAFLTEQSVILCRKGRIYRYERMAIKSVSLRQRIYLIPVIAGGIMTPLAIVALINDMGSLWILLILILSGMFLLYYGIVGGPAFTISTSVKEYDVFLSFISPPLRSFVRYINWQLMKQDDKLYMQVPLEFWKKIQQEGTVPSGTKVYLHQRELRQQSGLKILAINAHSQEIKLNFMHDPLVEKDVITLGEAVPVTFIQEI
jgi:hypothetical protein